MDKLKVFLLSFKSILVLFLFVNASLAEDQCTYELNGGRQITNDIQEIYSYTIQVTSKEECGIECCNEERCSAALVHGQVCMLVDCDGMGGCDFGTGSPSISLIRVTRQSTEDADDITSDKDLDMRVNKKDELSTMDTSSAPQDVRVSEGSTLGTKGDLGTEVPGDTKAPLTSTSQSSTAQQTSSANTLVQTETPTTEISTVSLTTKSNQPTTSSSEGTTSILPSTVTENVLSQPTSTTVKTVPAAPTTISTLVPHMKKLTVTAGGNQEIRLPLDSVTIHADVTPASETPYDYQWLLIKHPKDFQGTQSGITQETLKLATLTVGDYEFKVEVHGDNAYGEDFVNVTVLPKLRVNQPPVAVISPTFQQLTLPTDSTLLDGSKSHDDDGIIKYEWEEVQGPLQANKDENGDLPNTKVLQLKGLTVGNYTFRLTVTDTDKVTSSTEAVILVKNKIDNPPIANAGSNMVIHMPQNSAVLCGNDSTDDWGIVSYKWSLSPDSKNEVVDMQGARSQCLELSNLEVGDYTFQLQVTDEAGQGDTAKVTIIVQPESNHPPVAHAGDDQQLLLPLDNGVVSVSLDGSKSTDDKAITSSLWAMTEGPEPVSIVKSNALSTTVTGITVAGKYTFTLTVTDEDGASSSDSVVITVKDEQPPVANAGPDLTIILPDNVAMLDGSRSTDDYGITEYEWTRSDDSPAAGYVLNHSDHQSILHVAGLVQGEYTFKLKVTNVRGKSSEDEAKLAVASDPKTDNLVELHLNANILKFEEKHKETVVRQLGVLLSLQTDDEIIVRSIYAEHGTGHIVVLFYVKTKDNKILPALEVTDSLNSKLKSDVEFLEFKFLRADTYVCENLCSGHGRCHAGSKECECDIFWMENFFRVYVGDGRRNCEWSVMYVGIICFLILTFVSCSVWFLTCYCLRKRSSSPYKRRKNYSAHEKARYEKLPLKPQRGPVRKNGYVRNAAVYKSSSIMRSLSSSSSNLSNSDDGKENTLFERKRLLAANGNGIGVYNQSFENETQKRKTSSSSVGKNSFSAHKNTNGFLGKHRNGGTHQSTLLRVGDSSGEEVL